jgi:putative ABC transport system permease protein
VSASVVARRQEVGTLRALGVSRRGVGWLFLGEAVALALPGCLIGVGLGRVLGWGAVELTSATVATLYVATAAAPPALTWADVWLAIGVGVPLALVAAALPAAEAARATPLAAMRGHDQIETRYRLRARYLVLPVVLGGVSWWLSTLDPIGGLPLAGYGAAVVLVFGAATLVPAMLFVTARAGRRVMGRVFGVVGFLAHANLSGAIPRLSVSVAALAVSLSMMVAIAVMIGSFRETVIQWVGQTLRADLFIGPSTRRDGVRQSTISPEVDLLVASHPDVDAIDRFRQVSVPYGDSQVYLGAGDFEVLLARGNLVFKAPADGRAAMRSAIGADAVVVSEAFAIRHRRSVGDDIVLTTTAGTRPFRVAAVYYDYSSDRGLVVMDRRTFGRHFGETQPTGLTVYLREGADPDRVRSDLLAGIAGRFRVYVYTNASLRREVLRIFDSTFAITYALEIIAILVAILGVSGTLLTLVLERQREIAVLRLVGTDRRQVRRLVVLEALMIGAVSQAVGLVVGVLLSLVLIFVINVQSFGWTIQFHLPLAFLAQMSVAILVATALAGLYPARRAATLHMAREVAEE